MLLASINLPIYLLRMRGGGLEGAENCAVRQNWTSVGTPDSNGEGTASLAFGVSGDTAVLESSFP